MCLIAKMTSSEVQPPMTSSLEDEASFVELQPIDPMVPVEEVAEKEQAAEQEAGSSQDLQVLSKVQEEEYELEDLC